MARRVVRRPFARLQVDAPAEPANANPSPSNGPFGQISFLLRIARSERRGPERNHAQWRDRADLAQGETPKSSDKARETAKPERQDDHSGRRGRSGAQRKIVGVLPALRESRARRICS